MTHVSYARAFIEPESELPLAPANPFRVAGATVRQVLDWYSANNPARYRSTKASKERARLYRVLSADLGNKVCATLRPCDLLEWVNKHGPDRADATRKRWNATVQRPFNFATELGLIEKNPFNGLSMPDGEAGRDWTDAEYEALLGKAKPAMHRFIRFIRFSGMRPGEMRGLLWSDVKYPIRAIVLEEHKTVAKTKKPRRIPLNSVMLEMLETIRRENPSDARHVFLNSYLNPWTMRSLVKAFDALRKRLVLPGDVKLHGGRHMFGTRSIMNDVNPVHLMEIMGHSHISTTMRYVHLVGKVDHLSEAMEKAAKTK